MPYVQALHCRYLFRAMRSSESTHRSLESTHRSLESAYRSSERTHRSLESAYRSSERTHRSLESTYRSSGSTHRSPEEPRLLSARSRPSLDLSMSRQFVIGVGLSLRLGQLFPTVGKDKDQRFERVDRHDHRCCNRCAQGVRARALGRHI